MSGTGYDVDVEEMLEEVYRLKDMPSQSKSSEKRADKRSIDLSDNTSPKKHKGSRRRDDSRDRHSSRRDRRRSSSRDRKRPRRRSSSRDRRRSRSKDTSGSRNREEDSRVLTEEEKDARTVLLMQLTREVTRRDIEKFLSPAGRIREVRMIGDRYSRRSKGVAYVEFYEPESVVQAFKLSGQRLCGGAVIIQPTMAQKNRVSMEATVNARLKNSTKLYVGNLHHEITEAILQALFEPFGAIDGVKLSVDPRTGVSRGCGTVNFKETDSASNALSKLDGYEVAGLPLKVCYAGDRTDSGISMLDVEDIDKGGMAMSSSSRSMLMKKLAANRGLDKNMKSIEKSKESIPLIPTTDPSRCVLLSNMFDPSRESIPDWDNVIANEVKAKASQISSPIHIYVDKSSSDGNVYLKFKSSDVARQIISKFSGISFTGEF